MFESGNSLALREKIFGFLKQASCPLVAPVVLQGAQFVANRAKPWTFDAFRQKVQLMVSVLIRSHIAHIDPQFRKLIPQGIEKQTGPGLPAWATVFRAVSTSDAKPAQQATFAPISEILMRSRA